MAEPTPSEIASWPPRNTTNPESFAPILIGTSVPLVLIMTGLVGLRSFEKARKRAMGLDDCIMVFAWFLAVTGLVIVGMETHFGIGLHTWDTDRADVATRLKLSLASECSHFVCVSVTKVAICLTYLLIFPFKTNRVFCYIAIAYLIAWATAVIFSIIFQCRHVSMMWNLFDKHRHCIDHRAFFMSASTLNSLSDILVFLWPVRYLRHLQVAESQRRALLLSFTIGLLICVAGFARIWFITVYFRSSDTTWNGAIMLLISGIEAYLGVICGCIPTTRPLFVRLFGKGKDVKARSMGGARSYVKTIGSKETRDVEVGRTESETDIVRDDMSTSTSNFELADFHEGYHVRS